jgi:A/G-specific adenine glycosylase
MKQNQLSGFRKKLRTWFLEARRDLPWRDSNDPYVIWVSEVMLQQTQVKTVVPYFTRFLERYPDIRTLASAELQDVLKSWEGLGYYARARNLHAAARTLAEHGEATVPTDYTELKKLKGVGDYIAAAVSSIAFGKPHAVVDGNVRRVLSRLLTVETPVNSSSAGRVFGEHAQRLLDARNPGDFNQAMMELGATICHPRRPHCERCPVSALCGAHASQRQAELPVRLSSKPAPKYHVAVGVVRRGDRVLITQREPGGLLGGLWEFPGGKVGSGESPEDACRREIAEEINLDVEVTEYVTHIDHAYSHFKIGVDVFACRYKAGNVKLHGPVDYRWVLVDEIDDYPFPGANHKFLPIVKERLKEDS